MTRDRASGSGAVQPRPSGEEAYALLPSAPPVQVAQPHVEGPHPRGAPPVVEALVEVGRLEVLEESPVRQVGISPG